MAIKTERGLKAVLNKLDNNTLNDIVCEFFNRDAWIDIYRDVAATCRGYENKLKVAMINTIVDQVSVEELENSGWI